MAFKLSAKIEGLEELVKQLRDELPKKMQTKILKKASTDGSKLILKSAKAHLKAKRTGLLKKSLGRKIKTYRSTGKVVAMVGPRTGYRQGKKIQGTRKRERIQTALGKKFEAAGVSPTRYAHLIEKGTKRGVAAQPFLRPALDENIGRVRQIFEQTIRDGLEHNRIGNVESDGVKGD